MRTPIFAWCLFTFAACAGCTSSQATLYATDPLLLYYKPLSDSTASLAERNAPPEPAVPPVPTAKRE
jgi:hypothetical protein